MYAERYVDVCLYVGNMRGHAVIRLRRSEFDFTMNVYMYVYICGYI